MNERELIARLQKRDETAFEELLRQYEKKVYTLCFRMCGNSEDAEEAAQDTFPRSGAGSTGSGRNPRSPRGSTV